MNQNDAYFVGPKIHFLVCCRILVIRLCVQEMIRGEIADVGYFSYPAKVGGQADGMWHL